MHSGYPRSEVAVYDRASSKVPLAAVVEAEIRKERKHRGKLRSHGYGYESFDLFHFAIERYTGSRYTKMKVYNPQYSNVKLGVGIQMKVYNISVIGSQD